MKKTLIALMALAGMASAADYTLETAWTADFGSQYLNADGTVKGYTTTLTSPGTFWDAAKLAVEGGAQTKSDGRIHMAGGNYGDFSSDFQLTLTGTLTSTTNGHISELKAGSTGNWLCLGYTNGNLTLTGSGISAATSTGSITTGTEYSFTLTKVGTTLTFAAGEVSVTATLNSAYSGTIDNLTIGGNTGENERVPMLLESVAMSNVTIVPESPAVPEPTTATLSLLALAGLAARRRRK